MLNLVVTALQAEVDRHKAKFRMEKLAQIFPGTLSYGFEKITDAFYSGTTDLAYWGLEQAQTTVQDFCEAVKSRDMEAFDNLEDDLKYIDRAIEQLRSLIDARALSTNQPEDEQDGYIYLTFLRDRIYSLRDYAREIDNEYNSE